MMQNQRISTCWSLFAGCLMLLLTSVSAQAAGDEAPSWLRQLATTNVNQTNKNVPAVVLLKEQRVTVDDDGKVTTVTTGAIKVLTREGTKEADATVSYINNSSKVKEFRAWLISPKGEVKTFGKDDVIDQTAALNDVYDEVRVKYIRAGSNVEDGAVFGYQWTLEERAFINQDNWIFQDRLPTLVSRYILNLPNGWRADSITFNHAEVKPTVSGTSYTWELRDLGYVEEEPASPTIINVVPRLAISYYAVSSNQAGASFTDWVALSRWLTQLTDAQSQPDEAIKRKAQSLTAQAKTDFERIKMIGEFVQKIQYISIQTNIARGGGYKPHSATEVFTKAYGDCKDKANLMRAMLKSIDIPAYLLVIYSGDPTFVREEWPSPQQFNHCIIAIQMKDTVPTSAVVTHPSLGKLLVFDPTDDVTPVGDLPDHEQNSFALLVAGDAGKLMRMPITLPEENMLERVSDLTLAADGTLSGLVRERSNGQAAVQEQRSFRYRSRADYQKSLETLFTRDNG